MPQLRITKNGLPLCTVGSNDVWMFSASMYGDIWSEERSELTVTGGGKRTAGGESKFLIWEMSHALRDGDHIAFFFEEGHTSTPTSEPFEDQPDSDDERPNFFGPMAESEILKLEGRTVLNPHCAWKFLYAENPELIAAVDSHRQNISLHLMWNEDRPQRMRVNLSKSSLREIVARSGGEELFLQYGDLGTRVEVIVGI
jgi:hypothetical protein